MYDCYSTRDTNSPHAPLYYCGRRLPEVIAIANRFECKRRVSWRSLVSYRWPSHFLRNIRMRCVLVPTCALTAATSFRSKLLPILLQHLVTNLLGPRLVAKAVSTIHVRLHVNPDVNWGSCPVIASDPNSQSIAVQSTFLGPRYRLNCLNNSD